MKRIFFNNIFPYLLCIILGILSIAITLFQYFVINDIYLLIFSYSSLFFVVICFNWKAFPYYLISFFGYFFICIKNVDHILNVKFLVVFISYLCIFIISFLSIKYINNQYYYILIGLGIFVICIIPYIGLFDLNKQVPLICVSFLFSYLMFVFTVFIFIKLQAFVRNIIKINNLSIYKFKNIYNYKNAKILYKKYALQEKRKLLSITFINKNSSLIDDEAKYEVIKEFVNNFETNLTYFFYWNNINTLSLFIDITNDVYFNNDLNYFYNNSSIIFKTKAGLENYCHDKDILTIFNIDINNTEKFEYFDLIATEVYFNNYDQKYILVNKTRDLKKDKMSSLQFNKIRLEIQEYDSKWEYINDLKNTYQLLFCSKLDFIKNNLLLNDLSISLLAKRYIIINELRKINNTLDNYIIDVPSELLSLVSYDINAMLNLFDKEFSNLNLILRIDFSNINPLFLQNLLLLSAKFTIIANNIDESNVLYLLNFNPKYYCLKINNNIKPYIKLKKILKEKINQIT